MGEAPDVPGGAPPGDGSRLRAIMAERSAKRSYLPSFEISSRLEDAVANFEAWSSEGREVRLAGRITALRPVGKLTFLVLSNAEAKLQAVASPETMGEAYAALRDLDVGDVVGVTGKVGRTRTDEASIFAAHIELLSKALRPLPDKWHGLRDLETRYRQRYVDLIATPQSRDRFVTRSRVISALRRHLDGLGFLEVETPVLHPIYGGGAARPFSTEHHALDRQLYLRIAQELYLKRLVVGGFERIYEIGRVFRNEGLSPIHNPEFTMLEGQQAYVTYEGLQSLIEGLLLAAVDASGDRRRAYQGVGMDWSPPLRRVGMAAAVAGWLEANQPGAETPQGDALVELFEEHVQATLIQPTLVLDFPAETSPLAAPNPDDPRFVQRVEIYANGWELGNNFIELTDPVEQARRFGEQAAARAKGDEEAHLWDRDYVRALEYGLPPNGGIGLGIDRLVMLLTDAPSIRDVLLFPHLRPEPELDAEQN